MLELNEIKTCIYCNLITSHCICPIKTYDKLVSQINEKLIKKGKWITTIYSSLNKYEYKMLKDKLGTGGTYNPQKIELRGKVSSRATKILESLGYSIC